MFEISWLRCLWIHLAGQLHFASPVTPLLRIPLFLAWLHRKHIDPRPDFGWCSPLQVIMRAIMVVPGPNLLQGFRHLSLVRDRLPRQFPFDSPNEPFHASVLPGTTRLDPLLADAYGPQPESEEPRYEDGFIVCAYALWSTIPLHGLQEFLQ